MPEDPKQKLTTWLTEGFVKPKENESITMDMDRTRLMVPGQKEWYHAALSLDDPYFTKRVHDDMKFMMSYKGRRSDDVVTSLASLETDDAINEGLQPVKDYMKEKRSQKKRRVSD
jgi:hypothetical protein